MSLLIVPKLHLVEVACFVGALSTNALTVGTGTRTLSLTADSPRLVRDMDVTLQRLGDANVWMRGRVMSRPWEPVKLTVTASSGAGTHSDWVVAAGTLRFSTGERGYLTAATDTPAQAFFPGRLAQAVDIRFDMFDRGTTYGQSRLEYGDIVLVDKDHWLATVQDYGLVGQPVKIWQVAGEDAPWSSATLLLQGKAAAPVAADGRLTLRVRGRSADFDVPAQPAIYAGNNVLPAGLEGTADDIKGTRKPRPWGGKIFEAPLPMVNASRLIWQASTGAVSVLALYDMGQALTAGAAYASQADMEANAPARGQYRVWSSPSGTYVRLGATPGGTVTADLLPQATASATYPGALMRAVVTGPGGLSAGEVDDAALTALDAVCPWPIGLWTGEGETVAQLLDRICAACGAWWSFTPAGIFTAGRLAYGTPVMTLRRLSHDVIADASTFDIIRSEMQQISDEEAGAPVYAVTVGYAHAVTVQTSPAGSVTAARRAFLEAEWRYTAQAADATTLARNPGARVLTLDTDQVTEAGAIALRDQQLALRKGRKRRLSITTRLPAARLSSLRLGQTVTVLDPSVGLWAARDLIILSLAIDARRDFVTIGLWG